MSRLSPVSRESLSAEGQALWDHVLSGRSSAAMRGPFSVFMHNLALADRIDKLEGYFRSEGKLSPADRELIILATVREMDARFAWARHEVRAKEADTNPEVVEVLRGKGAIEKLPQHERTIVEFVRSLLRDHAVSDDLYARALKELGEDQLIETVILMGNYSLIGLTINAFAIPEDSKTF